MQYRIYYLGTTWVRVPVGDGWVAVWPTRRDEYGIRGLPNTVRYHKPGR